jgi:hypothetical protein
MPRYKVRVKVRAEAEYEVEVDEANEDRAEAAAAVLWSTKLPEDFQVEKGYISEVETETEQLTWECVECEAPMTEQQYRSQDELCLRCLRVHAAVA